MSDTARDVTFLRTLAAQMDAQGQHATATRLRDIAAALSVPPAPDELGIDLAAVDRKLREGALIRGTHPSAAWDDDGPVVPLADSEDIPENKNAPCNICGRGWPYHHDACVYKQMAAALRDRESLLRDARNELDAWRRFAQIREMGAYKTHVALIARIDAALGGGSV